MEQHGGGTVLIADDHPLFREALRQVVAVTLPDHMVIQASSLKEAEAVTVTEGLDLVLLDINMPGMNGFNGLVHLCNIFPATPIVIVSADESVETVREAMTLGAWGFIPKSMDAPQMADAVQRVMAGEIFIPIDLSEGAASQDRYMVDDDFKKGYAALTSQQRKVLEMVVAGKSNKVIAYEINVAEGTVKSHVSTILHKLKVNSRTQAALNASKLMGRSRA